MMAETMPGTMADRRARLIEKLSAELGSGGVLTGEDVTARSCDPFTHVPPQSVAILRPRSTAEVARIMTLCHAAGQRVVTHGGRTGVVGGASATDQDLVISLERMNRILEIDPVGSTATVEAGAVIQAIHDAAAAHDLLYPIDLGSKGTATLGGTIATNAGGNRVIRWGMTRQNVLGLEVVLADGTIVDVLNSFIKNNTGYDLKQTFVGSEGTLGIVCKAVLKLVPKPTTQNVALVALGSYDHVLEMLVRARAMQQLSAFEVMWQDYHGTVAGHDTSRRLVDPESPYCILIEAMGQDEAADRAAFQLLLENALEAGLVTDAVIASSNRQIAEIWRVREGSEVLVEVMWPFVSFDISVGIRRADEFVIAVRAALALRFGTFRSVAFGHLGDSNIHIGVHIGPDTLVHSHAVESCVYEVVRDFGAALTAEHGIGTAKRDFLPQHVSASALATMQRLRTALDPDHLLNHDVLF